MKTEEKVNKALEIISSSLGSSLKTVILYGSVARGEEVHKRSDINLFVVIADEGLQPFKLLWKSVKTLRKLRVNPVIITERYISRSLDSFPLEFLDIAKTGKVLYGVGIDYITANISKEAVRVSCERELKSKLIGLKRVYLHSKGKTKGLRDLLFHSLTGLRVILLGLHYLQNTEAKANVVSLSQDAEISTELIKQIELLRKGELKLKRAELLSLFESYIEEIEKLTNWLDEFQLVDSR